MTYRVFLLLLAAITFFLVGGLIDYWQASIEHKKKLPKFLRDYFLVMWLIIYTGLLPLVLVYVASNFNSTITLAYVAAASIGSVGWDIVYSLLDTGKPISDQEGYFVYKGENYGLTATQILGWHVIRVIVGIGLLLAIVA